MSRPTVTVCDACGQKACFDGQWMCDAARTAGTREVPARHSGKREESAEERLRVLEAKDTAWPLSKVLESLATASEFLAASAFGHARSQEFAEARAAARRLIEILRGAS